MRFLILSLVLCLCLSSCQKDEAIQETGITIKTLKSNVNSDGFALDFDFSELATPFRDALNELGLSETEDSIFDDFFTSKMYVLTTGDGVCDEDFMFESSVFSLAWLNDTQQDTGSFEAFGAMINVTDPDNLEEGFEFDEATDLMITVEEVLDNQLIGSFTGKVGQEVIEGRFDVPRKSCFD